MCELPENATIRGYGLSYETEVTNGLTNQELQKKIDEMTFVRIHSPKGHKTCIVCHRPLTDEPFTSNYHKGCLKHQSAIIHLSNSYVGLDCRYHPIKNTVRSAKATKSNLEFLGVADFQTLLSHPIYGDYATRRFRNALIRVMDYRLKAVRDASSEGILITKESVDKINSDLSNFKKSIRSGHNSKCNIKQKGSPSICKALDKKGVNPLFQGITSRELIEELQSRGYKWDSMWVEEVEVKRRYVKM